MQIDTIIGVAVDTVPQVRNGNIKAFAVTAKNRIASLPDVPSVDEAGLPGLHFSLWIALWAPKGTPKDAIAKLNASAMDLLADPAMQQAPSPHQRSGMRGHMR